MELETRYIPIEEEGKIEGYAIYWDRSSKVGRFNELFMKDSLKESDTGVSLYYQHDKKKLLANSKAGTLKLKPDNIGLKYEAKLPKSQISIKEAIKRQDVQGVSVGFHCLQDEHVGTTRKIKNAELWEISLTDKPCHQTTISMRSEKKKRPHWSTLAIGV